MKAEAPGPNFTFCRANHSRTCNHWRMRDPDPTPQEAPGGGAVGSAALALWRAMLEQPQAILDAQLALATQWSEVALSSVTAALPRAAAPLIEPQAGDRRWNHPAWSENSIFDAMKQGYLLAARALLDSVDAAPGIDDATKTRIRFFAQHFCDALSPTNFAFLNPAVIEETARSGGANLERGIRHIIDDLEHNGGRPALVDRSAFTVGETVAATRGSVVFRNDLIELIQYAPTTPDVYARPLLIVPPWINKYYIFDLQPENSFVKYALDNGLQTFVISWRNPDAAQAGVTFDDYLFEGALAAASVVREIAGTPDLNTIGYCIGGTLTAMALAYLAQTDPESVHSATFFAALIDFREAGAIGALLGAEIVEGVEADMARHGVFGADRMSSAFNLLRANDLIWKVAIDRYLLGKPAPAFDLLFWNDDATAMPAAMHSYYLRNMYLHNKLARGELVVRDVALDLGAIQTPTYLVATIEDHIAPWKSVYKMTGLFGGDVRFRLAHAGHIAGIINPPAAQKGTHWTNEATPGDPDAWLAQAQPHAGSWWPDWLEWIAARSGERKGAPASVGTQKYPALDRAPGTYVFG